MKISPVLSGVRRPALSPALGRFSRFWSSRTDRERRILAAGVALLSLILLWLLLIDPALEARARWQKDLPELRNQLAQMRALSNEINSLPARPASAAAELSRPAIERSLNDKGLRPQSLTITDEKLTLSFTDVSFAMLTEWLQQWQSGAQLAVTDATVTARERLGRVDARLILQRAR